MNYFVAEKPEQVFEGRTAGTKAREDINEILLQNGFKQVNIPIVKPDSERKKENYIRKFMDHFHAYRPWKHELLKLHRGDHLIIQYPVLNHTLLFPKALKLCRRKGVSVTLLIHDLEVFRVSKKETESTKTNARRYMEETGCLKGADKIICHNDKMRDALIEKGIPAEKLISLGMFDYLVHEEEPGHVVEGKKENGLPLVVAGNLFPEKAGYAYDLPKGLAVNLYGVNFKGQNADSSAHYFGSFSPNKLPIVITGSFGLVWDGSSASSCEGVFGEYLKINNPHKTSLYLAAGMPVIVWNESAVADFILAHHCGLAVDSLDHLDSVLTAVTNEDYAVMKANAAAVGAELRTGSYTMRAIHRAMGEGD